MRFLEKKFSYRKSLRNGLVLLTASFPGGLLADTGPSETVQPIELRADSLRYEAGGEKVYAEGNVEVKNGDDTLTANTLIGFLSKARRVSPDSSLGGGMNLSKLEASGKVQYKSSRETAHSEEATYDLGTQILVLKGVPAEVIMGEATLIGGIIQYDRRSMKLEAWHNVILSRAGQILKAQRIVAYFKENGGQDQSPHKEAEKSKKLVLHSAYADGSVEVETLDYKGSAKSAKIEGDEMTFQGNVRIIQGLNLVVGDSGWYNIKTQAGGVRRGDYEKRGSSRSNNRVQALVYTAKPNSEKGGVPR